MLETRPLPLGALGIAVGALMGTVIPSNRQMERGRADGQGQERERLGRRLRGNRTGQVSRADGLRRVQCGGVLLGVGMGGFLDGILLHQILQWHQMLSSVLPPTTLEAMHTNMLWDGIFHAAVWLATLAGIFLVWSGGRRASRLPPAGWLAGLMLIGWGGFNFVEGLVNHHLLGIHHVRGWGPDPVWDFGFLASGPVVVVIGWMLVRRFGVPSVSRP